jgi:hypothetical protein
VTVSTDHELSNHLTERRVRFLRNIGVLTFHRCINYGSYWQARCLVEGLKDRGERVVLLDHRSTRVNRAEWRCAMQPTLPAPATREDRLRYAGKMRKFFDAFDRMPLSRPFELGNRAGMEEYSTVIIGSDEVWNLKHPWYGGEPLFYGEGLRAGKIAAYAASFGNFSASERLTRPWQDKLRRLNAISVRDFNSFRLIRDALGIKARMVLDPCLQFPEIITNVPKNRADREPFTVLYGHSFPTWFQTNIRRWAQANGQRLVSVGYRNDWADEQCIETGPKEFANLIGDASAVATNFFHGCVFSLVNGKPFVCCLSDYRSNKLADLAQLLSVEAHVMTEKSTYRHYEQRLSDALEPVIAKNIANMRENSNRYLNDVLR